MEEQRQKFKLKTQNLLKFREAISEPKPSKAGRKKKERSAGEIFSEGEEPEDSQQPPPRKKRCVFFFYKTSRNPH